MANVTVTSTNPAISVTKSNSVVNVSSTSSTITVSAVASLANANVVRTAVSATDAGGDGSFSYNSSTGVFTYTGPSAAEVRAHLSNTSPIQYNSTTGVIGIDSAALFTGKTTDDLTEGSTNLYLNGAGTTDDLTEGSTNKYFTNTNANTWFTTQNTGNLAEGGSNLYFTTSRARGVLSAADSGGFGSFNYNNGTGVFTYNGTTSADVRGVLSATSPLTYNSGTGTFGIDAITGLDSGTDVDIKAGDSIYNFIDKNDNSTTEVFKIYANGETTGASDQLFQVDEQGNVTLWGNNADSNQARLRLRKDGDLILTQGNFGASTHLQLNAKLAPTPAGMASGGTPRNGMWMRVASGTDPDSYTTKANSFIDFNENPYSSAVTGDYWDGMILGHDGGLTVAADWKGANSETAGFTVRRVRGGNVSATTGSAENLFRVRANGVVDFGQITGGQTPRARIDMTTSQSNLTIDQAEINDKFTLSNTGISGQAFGTFEGLQFQTSPAGEFFPNAGENGLILGNNSISTANTSNKNRIEMYGGIVDGSRLQHAVNIVADGNVNIGVDASDTGTNKSFTIYDGGSGSITEAGRFFRVDESGNVEINQAYTLPNADGSADQVITTNGSGVLTFQDAAGSGLTNAQVITHISQNPLTVGGNLNVTGNIIATGNIDYENVTDLFVTDQKITLNANAATNSNVQIIANRPQNTSVEVKWNEDTDRWTFTNDGSTYYNLATSTSDVAEGTNLYYTDGRFDTRLATKSTSNLTEGSNLYYTDARVDAHVSGGTGITYTAGSIVLDNTAVTPKTYGDATNIPQLTVDQQGRITAVSNVAVTATSADTSKTVIKTVIAAETLAKGDAVYISGGTGDNPEVSKADADDASKMPVFGVTTEAVSSSSTTDLVIYGLVESYDTTNFVTGDSLFVSTTAGALANTAPTGESALLQTVGKVIKGASSGGKITITGAGRTNATPNLNDGKIFIGNGSNQSTTATLDTSIVPENTNQYYTTARANAAIADYTGDMLEVNTIDVQDSLTVTNGLIVEAGGSANLDFSQSSFGILKVGPGNNTGHLESSFFDYGGKSIICDENLYVGRGLNFSRTALNINTRYTPGYTHTLASTNPSANVYINMGVGDIGVGSNPLSPAGAVANATVGIKTNKVLGSILGWHDPIDSSNISYDADPLFDPVTNINGWYSFKDLAKTTVDETFDANLTVTGITTLNSNVDLNANLDISRNLDVDGSVRPRNTVLKQFNETVIALGNQSGNIAALASFNAANGSIFTMTATGGIEISQIPNATAGSSYTLKVTQDGTGSHALTSTFKYQGGDKTLTTAGGNTDIISVVYDGTDYLATLSKDYY